MGIPSVMRGEFHYRDVLLVDVGGELKRHARASESELKALLQGKNSEDKVGHWWEAQLIHYGLQRSKQKNTAKVRLQQALSQGKLKSQPPHLADMEGQMKKDYAAAVRKAAKITHAAGRAPSSRSTTKGTKRAHEEESASTSKKTKISLRVGDVSIDIDHSPVSAGKKQKPSTKSASIGKSSKLAVLELPATLQTAKSAEVRTHFSNDNVFQNSIATPKPRALATPPSRTTSVKKKPGVDQKAAHAKNSSSSSATRKGYLFDADAMDTRADLAQDKLQITGVYTIECPQITDQLPDQQNSLRLFMCVDNESGTTWGGFELAMKLGVLKMEEIEFNRKLTFGWRARDSWEGKIRFGQKCFGSIEFDGSGGVHGVFHSLFNEPCEFKGRRRPGPLWSGRSPYKYQQEWDDFPREAYGR